MFRIVSNPRPVAGAAFAAGLSLAASAAPAQPYAINWSALTAGGRTSAASAGSYTLRASLGQALAGVVGTAGPYSLSTGFLVADTPAPCYSNCNASTTAPVVNTADFTCFLQQYSAAIALPAAQQQAHYANCDGSTIAPQVNTGDFTCFLQKYAAGCS